MNDMYKVRFNGIEYQEAIKESILNAGKIVILRHQWADYDAVGSQYGLAKIIEEVDDFSRKVVVGGILPINLKNFGWPPEKLTKEIFTDAVLVVVDTADSERIDLGNNDFNIAQVFSWVRQVVKIDHHPTPINDGYPQDTLRLVNTKASSCAEILAEIFEIKGETADQELVEYLYTGIIGDTGRLAYGFSARTMRVLANLLEQQPVQLFADINHSFGVTSLEEARMKAYYYSNLMIKDDTAWLIVDQELLNKNGWPAEQMALFVNCLGTVRGIAKWVLCIQYEDGTWRLRVRSQNIDISKLARKYGGGGHPFASGVKMSKKTSKQELADFIEKLVKVKKN